MKRREFIQTAALTLTTTAMTSNLQAAEKRKMGLQLYSLRDVILKDTKGVLKKVADLGYNELETYSYHDGQVLGMKSTELSKAVKDLGMKITSGHYETGQSNPSFKGTLTNDWERAVADAKEAGMDYMVIAHLDEKERQSIGDYKKICSWMNKGGETCKKYGVRFGYHNHAFEFNKVEGQVPYDVMLAELDPKFVSMEMDIYWIVFAGQDPFQYFAKYPGRFEQWHVKDMSKTVRTNNADIGTGTIDFKAVFAKASEAGLKHFYIEQETYPVSPMESVAAGIKYMKTII